MEKEFGYMLKPTFNGNGRTVHITEKEPPIGNLSKGDYWIVKPRSTDIVHHDVHGPCHSFLAALMLNEDEPIDLIIVDDKYNKKRYVFKKQLLVDFNQTMTISGELKLLLPIDKMHDVTQPEGEEVKMNFDEFRGQSAQRVQLNESHMNLLDMGTMVHISDDERYYFLPFWFKSTDQEGIFEMISLNSKLPPNLEHFIKQQQENNDTTD